MDGRNQNIPELQTPFPRSYWVIPGRLLAGEYPGDADPEKARIKIGKLLDAGIRQIINLMDPAEEAHVSSQVGSYESLLASLARKRHIQAVMHRFPVVDMRTPAPDMMTAVLDAIDAALDKGMPVYVHCWGGIGRTGTVVGCFLIRHGLAHSGNVFAHIATLRSNDPEAHRISPESPAQRDFVRHWPF